MCSRVCSLFIPWHGQRRRRNGIPVFLTTKSTGRRLIVPQKPGHVPMNKPSSTPIAPSEAILRGARGWQMASKMQNVNANAAGMRRNADSGNLVQARTKKVSGCGMRDETDEMNEAKTEGSAQSTNATRTLSRIRREGGRERQPSHTPEAVLRVERSPSAAEGGGAMSSVILRADGLKEVCQR